MSHSAAIRHHQPAAHVPGRVHHLLVGGLFGVLIGALGFAIVVSTVDVVQGALARHSAVEASATLPAREYPARPLPREWSRWEMGVDVEHMYRQKQSPQLDWIREGRER